MFRKNSGIEKFQAKEGEASRLCRKFFYLTGPKKLRQGTTLCFRNFLVGKNILWIRGGGYHDFPSKFLSHCTEIFHWRTLWCFTKKIFYRKFSCIGEGGGWHHGFVNFFLSHRTETKSFVKEPFCFRNFSGIEKNLWIRGGLSRFSVEFFMSHSAEKFLEGILLFLRKFLVSKSFMDEKGGITFFRRNFLVSQCRKISWASLRCFRKFGVSKNFMYNKGYHNFPSIFF